MSIKTKNTVIALVVTLAALFFLPGFVQAEEVLITRSINLDQATVQKGYTYQLEDKSFRLGILPGSLLKSTEISLKVFSEDNLPTNKELVSRIYEFDIKNPGVYIAGKPLVVDIRQDLATNKVKQIHFWDGNQQTWRPVRTWNDLAGRSRAFLFLPYAKLAIFAENSILETGTASWYKYKGCDCAASPDFPKDTLLKVTNLDNKKSVVVKVNDFGPDRNLHPGRVIDLDLTAFKKIGSKTDGIINIRLEPLDYFIPVSFNTPKNSALTEVKSKAAILVDGWSGEVLWSKNQDAVLPIASLTKLMTAYIFLQTNTPMDQVTTYQKEDDAEGAKVYLQPGDQLTTKDVFYSMLIGSANNMAKLLVRSSGLTNTEFVERMNQQAQYWGMTNTHFIEPTGLNPGNVSTVEDLAVLSQRTLAKMEMLWATAAKGYAFTTINTKKEHKFKNTNPLTYQSDLAITGSKTGYLEEAGYCLMTRAKGQTGGEVIAIVLNSPDSATRFNEVKELISWGFERKTGSLLAMKGL